MEKYPIVILPGWMLPAPKYRELAQLLAQKGHQTFVLDFPGFDKQPLPKVYTLTDYVIYLQKFIRQHNIHKAVFIAHSFGGRVALKYLSQNPQKAVGLIISGTPGFINIARIKLIIFISVAKIGGIFFSLPILKNIKDLTRKAYYKIIGARDFYHTQGFMRETFKNVIKEPLNNYMKKIRVPTLLLWGQKDKTVPVKIAKKMHKTILNSKLEIIPEMGHMFVIKDAQIAFDSINNFINSL
ncbi:MAG: hypothetical protein UT84_C0040G0003 [Candidatus Curtissbacteria bacterium GW2011_GWA1_40_16]|uniref:Serine aminopeptidase S33 domain-containing protein n=1 Tax=Candidatus Curtissbacteria bacterium GW2011_GWA1_40_16 TaxID=1618405 RepID=A0A0G0UDT1_9BACT|nr:MAG: hypothetical protein UT84_C0040G0003 [Candidatus Curtissbacteria bacterium GW2011_GWA1_40_16]